MTALSQAAYRAADIRAVEARAAERYGLAGTDLMERAGDAAFALLRARWPDARSVTVLAGPGNNGGDGRVVARLAAMAGFSVTLVAADSIAARGPLPQVLGDVDVIVDALFGIGLNRAPDGATASCIEAMNAHRAPVLALDIPSGLHADDGTAPGAVVCADATITFLAAKRGLFTADGPRCCGRVIVADLGVPAGAFDGCTPVATLVETGFAARALGPRATDAHKGRCGHVLVIGGRSGMSGAARLAGEAALRCGAGLVSIAAAPGSAAAIGAGRPELMVHECANADALVPLLERASVIALGPGLGTDAWAQAMTGIAFRAGVPVVVDADALNLLAASPFRRTDWILTPHPGEAARLLGRPVPELMADRFGTVEALVERTGGVVVLKGAATIVGVPDSTPYIITAGNPGMASGGMGDLLTGVIAALRAQGLDAATAACAGAQVHAEAGDAAAERFGARGMVASDLFRALQRGVNGR
ncbi:MAG: NAD(P)H-hydrate dehydratase [Xanthomonadaceae bacterium]|nr:NAD(P)H-hydrate dehydratase [Xanthomonadaceae bacterium]